MNRLLRQLHLRHLVVFLHIELYVRKTLLMMVGCSLRQLTFGSELAHLIVLNLFLKELFIVDIFQKFEALLLIAFVFQSAPNIFKT